MADMPEDQLTRTTVHERESDWPDRIELIATWGKKRRAIEISKAQFFGTGTHGAPINGDQLVHMIHTLRRQKP